MKNNSIYEAPQAVVVYLETADVITASVFTDSNVIEDGWIEA